MSDKFQGFLIDLLGAIEPFKDVVTHVMMREVNGGIVAAAKARDGTISVQAKSKGEVPGFTDKACLGSLSYLRSALSSSYMIGGTVNLSYGKASNGKDEVLRSMKLKGAKGGYNVYYQAIDPFINQLNRIKLPTGLEWPVGFAIDETFMEHFAEVVKVSAQAPKAGTERDDIFQMVQTEEGVEGIFGDKNHQVTVLLSATVEANPATEKTNAYFSISKVRSILRFVGKGSAIGYLSDKALRVDTETEHAEYQFVTASKKVRANELV